jgi:hypothetical protein
MDENLSLQLQFQTAMRALSRGDIDLLEKVLTEPNSITPEENKTAAESLGLKRGFLATVVNVATDPTVWIAALMSRAFPTMNWIRGTVPQRFVGAANEFNGVSLFSRTVEGFFRGTTVPRLTALKQKREIEVLRTAEPLLNALQSLSKDDAPIVSLLMEGQHPPGATDYHRQMAVTLRGGMEGMWGFLKQAKKVRGGFEGEEITKAVAEDFIGREAPKHLRDYLPHMPLTGNSSMFEISGREAMRRTMTPSVRQAMELRGEGIPWSVNASDQLASDFTRWQSFVSRVGHQINPRLFKRHRHGITLGSAMGQELFVSDLHTVLPRYIHSVARTYANHAPLTAHEQILGSVVQKLDDGTTSLKMPTTEPIMVQIINEGLEASGGRFMQQQIPTGPGQPLIFKDVLIPGTPNMPSLTALNRLVRNVAGTADDSEILFGNMWSSVGKKLDQWKGNLTGKQMSEVDAAMKAMERNSSFRNVSNGLASYLYGTTLGLNPWSTLQNLLQPILTTIPSIGIGPTLRGYKALADRLPLYVRRAVELHKTVPKGVGGPLSRFNHTLEKAFRETFPELAEQGITADPRLFDVDPAALTTPEGLFRGVEEWNKLILQPFTHAEMANQVVTFYGGREAIELAMRTGEYALPRTAISPVMREQVKNFEAGMLVASTQFRPGAGSRTVVQSMLPAPLRQFTSFFTRWGNFLVDSTVRGAMTNAQIQQASIFHSLLPSEAGTAGRQKLFSLGTGRNVGVAARAYVAGRIVTEGASQALGVDLSGAMGLLSPFPDAPEDQPLAPLPLPPAVGIVHGIYSAAANRDIKRLQPMMLPGGITIPVPKALFPGGVAISRAVRAAQQFKPDMGGFVDDNERLMQTGGDGELALAMLGVPLDKNRRSREAMEIVGANRLNIRKYRRAFTVAKINADTNEMMRLQNEYQEAYPELPPLDVADKDVRRYQAMSRIAPVQRMLQSLGARSKYLEADLYEYDPELLAPRSPLGGIGELPGL